jgi:hypothetical protein
MLVNAITRISNQNPNSDVLLLSNLAMRDPSFAYQQAKSSARLFEDRRKMDDLANKHIWWLIEG